MGSVVKKVDSDIHGMKINRVNNVIDFFPNTHPLDCDLSGG